MSKNLLRFLGLSITLACSSTLCASEFSSRNAGAADLQRFTRAPAQYRAISLNFKAMESDLARATEVNPARITLPFPDGTNREFDVVPVEVMEPALAAKFPRARSYRGVLTAPKTAAERVMAARLNTGSGGFSAMIFGLDSVYMVEPTQLGEAAEYISFDRASVGQGGSTFSCGVNAQAQKESIAPSASSGASGVRTTTGGTLRTYRLALAATGEYSAFFGGTVSGTVENGLVPAMNRVNEVYQREFALRMVLVANNNLLVYLNGATDPYSNDDGVSMLGQNQSNIDTVIGSANYDIGHVFSTGGGGVASLRSPCAAGSKARGVTGQSAPTGDPFWIDYVAHEMGHQWGGNHTFNGTTGACGGGNRSAGAAYEPGSGTTIQAYAGICGGENLQSNSDPWFHAKSLDEMQAFISGNGNACAVTQASNNLPPTADAGPAYTIPARTPFILTGSGSDPEGRPLIYLFEQYNLGASSTAATISVDDGTRPLFRSFNPSTQNFRIFPRLSTILGTAPAALGETLPTTSRTLTFRLTVRDQATNGALAIGAAQTADVNITTVDSGAGFAITSQNSSVTWPALSTQTITWNVANTTAAPISCANVQIALSLDQGQSFDRVLLASTENDGTADIIVPSKDAPRARVRVQCVGNIFFDINNTNITTQSELFENDFENR